jgi:hypothetical protein
MTRQWYRWPEDRRRGIVPWWTILRRVIFVPFLWLAAVAAFIGYLGGYGFATAKREWKR